MPQDPDGERGPWPGLTHAECHTLGCPHPECKAVYKARQRFAEAGFRAGTARRLRALARNGWDPPSIASELDQAATKSLIEDLCAGRDEQALVDYSLYAAVCQLYDARWDRQGPSPSARRQAQALRWPLALMWDDEPNPDAWRGWAEGDEIPDSHWIDDPAAVPVDCERSATRVSYEGLAAALTVLARRGYTSYRAAAEYIRVAHGTLIKQVSRARARGLRVPLMPDEARRLGVRP